MSKIPHTFFYFSGAGGWNVWQKCAENVATQRATVVYVCEIRSFTNRRRIH